MVVPPRAPLLALATATTALSMERPRVSATIGPASSDAATLRAMVRAGMSAARVNLSYGRARDNVRKAARIRRAAAAEGRPVAVVADLPGPKVRLGDLPGGTARVRPGQTVTLAPRGGDLPLRHPLGRDVAPGDRLLLKDGRVRLRVTDADAASGRVRAKVERGGRLTSRAGVIVQGRDLPRATVDVRDRRRLAQLARIRPEQVWLSFVTSAGQVRAFRRLLAARGLRPRLLAKIETHAGLARVDEILDAADGIVIAWGDLRAVVPLRERARVDADLARRARARGKLVVAHTGYLDALRAGPHPSPRNRRELANLARAGVDFVGLDETADGPHPVAAVAAAAAAAGRPRR